jgi:hypothetical protein
MHRIFEPKKGQFRQWPSFGAKFFTFAMGRSQSHLYCLSLGLGVIFLS